MPPKIRWGAVITAVVVALTLFTTSAEATMVCFKPGLNVAVRTDPWVQNKPSNSTGKRVPSTVNVTPRSDGWARYKGGWIFTGTPNVQPCGATTAAPKSSKSLPPEPKSSGFRLPTIPSPKRVFKFLVPLVRDLETAERSVTQLPFVKFCEKHRSNFGWNKCFIDADKALVFVARLKNLNTNADARKDARNKLKNMLQANPLGQTQVRLDKVIDQDLTGVSAGRWNSKRVKGLESLAERLADSQRVSDFERFVSKTHPKLKEASALLKQQHPVFMAEATKVRIELAPPKLTPKQERLVKEAGVDPRVFVANEVFLAVDPSARFNKRVSEVESTLPMDGAKFSETVKGLAGVGHDVVFAALKDGSEMTVNAYAKSHKKLKPYAEDASNYLAQREAGAEAPVTCNGRKNKDLENCRMAVDETLVPFVDVVQPSVVAAFTSFKTLQLSSTTEELKVNVQIARDAFNEKFDSFSNTSVIARLQTLVMNNLYVVIGACFLVIALIILVFRRRHVSRVGSHGFDLFPFN